MRTDKHAIFIKYVDMFMLINYIFYITRNRDLHICIYMEWISSLFSTSHKSERIIIRSRLHGKHSMLSDDGIVMTRFYINGLINLVSLSVSLLQVQVLGGQGIAQQLLRVL